MVTAFSIVVICYCSFLIWVLFEVWSFTKDEYMSVPFVTNKISIVIPFKDERRNLRNLIECIKDINYPRDCFEVLFVNDYSSDEGVKIIKNIIPTEDIQVRLFYNSDKASKKNALLKGVKESKFEWILQLDADITFNPEILNSYNSKITKRSLFIAGPVIINRYGFWSGLLQSESLALLGITIFGILTNAPQMANAANMIWNKKILDYGESEDIFNSKIRSGDDLYLMNRAFGIDRSSISFNSEARALVKTSAPDDFKKFFNQRIRWASKWAVNNEWFQTLFPPIVWLFHLIFIIGFIHLIINGSLKLFCVLFISKLLLEWLLLKVIANNYSLKASFKYAFVMQFLYSFYVVFFGLISRFTNYNWK